MTYKEKRLIGSLNKAIDRPHLDYSVYRHGGNIAGRTQMYLQKYKGERLNLFQNLEILSTEKY